MADGADPGDESFRPELWHISLEMLFDDSPDLVGVDAPHGAESEFAFEPIGPTRAAALANVRAYAESDALARALWASAPASSSVVMEAIC